MPALILPFYRYVHTDSIHNEAIKMMSIHALSTTSKETDIQEETRLIIILQIDLHRNCNWKPFVSRIPSPAPPPPPTRQYSNRFTYLKTLSSLWWKEFKGEYSLVWFIRCLQLVAHPLMRAWWRCARHDYIVEYVSPIYIEALYSLPLDRKLQHTIAISLLRCSARLISAGRQWWMVD